MPRVRPRSLRKCATRLGALSLCVGALSAACGCAPSGTKWTKFGMTSTELRRDLADCERQATGPGPFHFEAPNEDYETARDRIPRERGRCMEGRGWQVISRN